MWGWGSRLRAVGGTNRTSLLAVRARDDLGRGWFGPPVYQLVSRSFGGGFVLLNYAGGDAPALADRDALVFRPRPDAAAAVTA